jgi:SWI/SNF-related matrix-associated actin-dependent regulator of chromatin subfamily A-like protein 1
MLAQFDSGGNEARDSRQAITQAYTLTGQAKLRAVKEYVLDLLNNDIKILIFGHHMLMLDGL